jgi:DNA polymerase-3 subunit epsilon
MLNSLFGLDAQRKRLLKKAPAGPLKDYLSVSYPDRKADVYSVPIVSLDFETTGLDSSTDRILSAGHVELQGGEVLLATAKHTVVQPDISLSEESVVIHGITDDAAAFGKPLDTVIGELLSELTGKVMLAHHAAIEQQFLRQACKQLYGMAPVMPVIDTLSLARKWLARRNKEPEQGGLRLYALREHYGLPRYNAHNALSDALATAELFLAQVEHMDSRNPPSLGSLMS